MRTTLIATVTAALVGGAAAGALMVQAQPAPPPDGPRGGMEVPWQRHSGWMGWRHHRFEAGREGRVPFRMDTFALIYRQADRNLSPPDVQKIAEAFLLWRGNHTWKVVDVAPTSDGAIGFSLATQEGSVVAKFTMDPHSGHVTRVG